MNEADYDLRVIVFRACHLAVWADRAMTADEQRYLSHLTETLGRTQRERKALRELRLQDVNEELLRAEIRPLGAVEKSYVFDTCLEILASDRRINARELRFLARLRKVCDVGYWSYQKRLTRERRRARAWVYPRRTIAVLGIVLLTLLVVAQYKAFRSRSAAISLDERCTGREVSVALFSASGPPPAAAPTGQDVFERVRDSIVVVNVLVGNDPVCSGSGAVIGADEADLLYIVTNRHVIDGAYPVFERQRRPVRVEVGQYSGARFDATLDFYSRRHDLAILTVKGMKDHARPLSLNLKSGLQVGQPIYAIGSPIGLKHTFTAGVISAFRESYLQTDATVYSGSSGGPLIDSNGALCAVVTKVHRTKDYGFALYADLILDVLAERRERSTRSSGTSFP